MKRIKNFLNEFKTFASRGNVIDLSVGVIIGAAFGKITTSLVNDIIMPLVGLLLGGVDFATLSVTLPSLHKSAEPAVLQYGLFLNAIVDFFIIAWCVFVLVKVMNGVREKTTAKEAAAKAVVVAEPTPEPVPTTQELLLQEIRDLLKEKA